MSSYFCRIPAINQGSLLPLVPVVALHSMGSLLLREVIGVELLLDILVVHRKAVVDMVLDLPLVRMVAKFPIFPQVSIQSYTRGSR